jgi:hypothetical protein
VTDSCRFQPGDGVLLKNTAGVVCQIFRFHVSLIFTFVGLSMLFSPLLNRFWPSDFRR